MVIRASKNEIARPQQLYSSRIRELALTNRDLGTETHTFNMVFKDVNLGATLFDIGAGGAIQTIQIRFGDDIWIDQEEPAYTRPRQKLYDGATGTATTHDSDAEFLESFDSFDAYCQGLPLQKIRISRDPMFIDWCTGIDYLGANDAHTHRLRLPVCPPDASVYRLLAAKEQTDQDLAVVSVTAL